MTVNNLELLYKNDNSDTLAIVEPFWTSHGVGETRTAEGSAGTARVTVAIDQMTYPVDEHAKNPAAGIG